jgi:hypothetical protein
MITHQTTQNLHQTKKLVPDFRSLNGQFIQFNKHNLPIVVTTVTLKKIAVEKVQISMGVLRFTSSAVKKIFSYAIKKWSLKLCR